MRHNFIQIRDYHKRIADAHRGLNGFYRFNINELSGSLRDVGVPVLMLEAYSVESSTSPTRNTHFLDRDISLLILDSVGELGDYDGQDEALNRLENVALDIKTLLVKDNKDENSFLYGLFDAASFRYEKVGPIMGSMFGWNVLYQLKDRSSATFDPSAWDETKL